MKQERSALNSLIAEVVIWHHNRKLIHNSTDQAQFLKLIEEVGELAGNIARKKPIEDDVGDILVVLINIAARNGTTLEDCLSIAWHDIKHRTGHMTKEGIFVKDDKPVDLQ